jgi:ankyrin repeat protein
MSFPAETEGNSVLLTLPNELLSEVASNLESFEDFNSLVRTSRFFHTLFNTHLYRRAVAAEDAVREDIVQWALSHYPIASLTLLLDNGLSVHQKLGEDSEELLRWICCVGNIEDRELSVTLARLLIERGANVTGQNSIDSSTVLHAAAFPGNHGLVALLLANGADVAATNDIGRTPLHFAVQDSWPSADSSTIDLLIAHGATIDARDSNDETPLLVAASEGNMLIIPALLEHGADARACNKGRATPLHFLWRLGDDGHEVAKSLLEHGADVNAADESGKTPLHRAADIAPSDDFWKVKFLLRHGADANALTRDGRSPLKDACNNIRWSRPWKFVYIEGCRLVMRMLIAYGADVSVLTDEDRAIARLH